MSESNKQGSLWSGDEAEGIDPTDWGSSPLAANRPTAVFSSYWSFAAERQKVFHRRRLGLPGPWTQDPILSAYRFTNAYRATDRVSQYLIKNVIYAGDQSANEVVFRVLLFKFFNKIETWETLARELGPPCWSRFNATRYGEVLSLAQERGDRIFSSAYIMPTRAPGFRHARKHDTFLGLLDHMMREGVASRVASASSLGDVYRYLREFPLLGDFLAFQYAIDLNYSEVVDFDEADFVVAGPGAKSGLRKCFASLGRGSEEDAIRMVADCQEEEFARQGLSFEDLFGRPLKPIDCQNLFCETDKYARVAHPNVKGIGDRTRIKRSYSPQPGAIDLWFPPKWGLNDRIEGTKA